MKSRRLTGCPSGRAGEARSCNDLRRGGVNRTRTPHEPIGAVELDLDQTDLAVCGYYFSGLLGGKLRRDYDAYIGFDWRDCCRRCGAFGVPNFGQVVGRKEFVRVSGQGCRRNWKTCHAGKRRRCRTESRPTSGAALRGGRDLQPPTRLSNLLYLSKKKGTGTMAGPPTRSSLSLAFRNNWRRRRGFALAVRIASVLRIARSDAEESQRRCSQ